MPCVLVEELTFFWTTNHGLCRHSYVLWRVQTVQMHNLCSCILSFIGQPNSETLCEVVKIRRRLLWDATPPLLVAPFCLVFLPWATHSASLWLHFFKVCPSTWYYSWVCCFHHYLGTCMYRSAFPFVVWSCIRLFPWSWDLCPMPAFSWLLQTFRGA